MTAPEKKQPTVFILYIPGGAALGLIPALTLSRIEALIETPVRDAFQVIEGVSTGSILTAGYSLGITAKKSADLFVRNVARILPDSPGRLRKMHLRIGFNMAKDHFRLDPLQHDHIAIKNIVRLCNTMRQKNTFADRALIDLYEQDATKRWLTAKTQSDLLKLGQKIGTQDSRLEKYTNAIAELVATRTYTSRLKIPFSLAVSGLLDGLKDVLAKQEDCYIDPKRRERIFKDLFGDTRIGESIGSTYISTYNVGESRVETFSCLKKDIFNQTAHTPATVRHDIKLWDAVMASTANLVLFPTHITETNILCSDKATIHRPRCVNDVIAAVPRGTEIVLVIAGTGQFLGSDLLHFMEKNGVNPQDPANAGVRTKDLEDLRTYYTEYGVAGNLAKGQEVQELEAYTITGALDDFRQKLGPGNVFDFTPRLAAHTPREQAEFPSRNTMDSSPENMEKIARSARRNNREKDREIRALAQRLADNLYLLGKMDRKKYDRVCERLARKGPFASPPPEQGPAETKTPAAYSLKTLWGSLGRAWFRTGRNAEGVTDPLPSPSALPSKLDRFS